jgi:hypothetical protein
MEPKAEQPIATEQPAQPVAEQPAAPAPEPPADPGNEPDEKDVVAAEGTEVAPESAAAEPGDAPIETPVEADDPDDTFRPNDASKLPEPVDIQAFIDGEGNLDLKGFQAAQAAQTQAIVDAAVGSSRQERAYEKTWDKAYAAYPELRTNKELRDMVQAIHANSPQTGKYLSPTKAADKLFGLRGQAKKEGMQAAREVRSVQAAAALGSPNGASSAPVASSKITELRAARENAPTAKAKEDANKALIAELVRTGAI